MKLLCQALIVALIVSSHERFAHGKTLSHKKHHRSTNRKHNKHAADAVSFAFSVGLLNIKDSFCIFENNAV